MHYLNEFVVLYQTSPIGPTIIGTELKIITRYHTSVMNPFSTGVSKANYIVYYLTLLRGIHMTSPCIDMLELGGSVGTLLQARTTTEGNKQLNFSVKRNHRQLATYFMFEAYFMMRELF